jgi:hypothetical protein
MARCFARRGSRRGAGPSPIEPFNAVRPLYVDVGTDGEDRYRRHLADGYLDPDDGWFEGNSFDQPEMDAAILVGLLLRGWRMGMDAEAGITLASGVSAADDLAWWCERAVEAASRVL